MIPLEKHEEEMFWLKRRIAYLEKVQALSTRTSAETLIERISPQFSKVATPRDLVERLEEVYEGDLP
jgi:hypothetical protein